MTPPECPRCSGSGIVYVYENEGDSQPSGTVQCGRCNGTGVAR